MQIIVHNMNLLPRSYWTEARSLFRYVQYNCIAKNKKGSSNEDMDCSIQEVLS